MLREFLCLQGLLGNALVSLPLLALFLLPLGLGLNDTPELSGFPWWGPPAVPLALLVVLLVWVTASCLGLLPTSLTPWTFASELVWFDACCLCQHTPETIDAGVEGFKRFVEHADKMVAFVSPNYFERLWCVYELATFCKMHRNDLQTKLLLLSIHWPSSLYPFKRGALSRKEIGWLQNFSCLHAQCYKPADRAMLMERIREEWESEEAFDKFVREDLLEVMVQSKRQYQHRILNVAGHAFELIFGD